MYACTNEIRVKPGVIINVNFISVCGCVEICFLLGVWHLPASGGNIFCLWLQEFWAGVWTEAPAYWITCHGHWSVFWAQLRLRHQSSQGSGSSYLHGYGWLGNWCVCVSPFGVLVFFDNVWWPVKYGTEVWWSLICSPQLENNNTCLL